MTIKDILSKISYKEFVGDEDTEIIEIIPLNMSNEVKGSLMWLNEKNIDKISMVNSGTLIIPIVDKSLLKSSCNYILTDRPRETFKNVLEKCFTKPRVTGVSKTAVISPKAVLGSNLFVGENVVIEEDCIIGDDSDIGHNTVIKSNTVIGKMVAIGCNCTIGGVGFGYERSIEGEYQLIPHIGGVLISDNVEIGNNTCIDRGVINNTFVGRNVKIDNLVHIAHGAVVNENSLIIANAMVAGSTVIGKNVWVAPSSSLINKITIGDNSVIGMGAVVVRNVEEGSTVVGNPGKPLIKK